MSVAIWIWGVVPVDKDLKLNLTQMLYIFESQVCVNYISNMRCSKLFFVSTLPLIHNYRLLIHIVFNSYCSSSMSLMLIKLWAFSLVFNNSLLQLWPIYWQVETRGCTLLALELAELLGKEECGVATANDSLILRLMMPVAKLYTAKQV